MSEKRKAYPRKRLHSAGMEIKALLIAKNVTQLEVCRRMRIRGFEISLTGLNHFLNGEDTQYGAEKFNLILSHIPVTDAERHYINQCAVRDMGWKIGWKREERTWKYDPRKPKPERLGLKNPYKVKGLKVQYQPDATYEVKINGS